MHVHLIAICKDVGPCWIDNDDLNESSLHVQKIQVMSQFGFSNNSINIYKFICQTIQLVNNIVHYEIHII